MTDKNQSAEDTTHTSNNCKHENDATNTKYRVNDQCDATEDDENMGMTHTQRSDSESELDSGSSLSSPSSPSSPSTDAESCVDADSTGVSRTAQVETTHTDVELVAAAVRPDNTASMTMSVDNQTETLQTTITRETTGGMQSTVDDMILNLTVADAVITAVEQCRQSCIDSESQSQSQSHTSQTHE